MAAPTFKAIEDAARHIKKDLISGVPDMDNSWELSIADEAYKQTSMRRNVKDVLDAEKRGDITQEEHARKVLTANLATLLDNKYPQSKEDKDRTLFKREKVFEIHKMMVDTARYDPALKPSEAVHHALDTYEALQNTRMSLQDAGVTNAVSSTNATQTNLPPIPAKPLTR